jgi:hypothetical protein
MGIIICKLILYWYIISLPALYVEQAVSKIGHSVRLLGAPKQVRQPLMMDEGPVALLLLLRLYTDLEKCIIKFNIN